MESTALRYGYTFHNARIFGTHDAIGRNDNAGQTLVEAEDAAREQLAGMQDGTYFVIFAVAADGIQTEVKRIGK